MFTLKNFCTLGVVAVFERAEWRLVTHQLASVGLAIWGIRAPSPVLFPVDLQGTCATFIELLHVGTAKHFVSRYRDFQVVSELFVVFDTVLRLGNFSRATALYAAVDDLVVTPKPWTRPLALSWSFGCRAVDNLKHAWFWRLWIGEEEDGARRSAVSATSSGLSSSVRTSPYIASENGP